MSILSPLLFTCMVESILVRVVIVGLWMLLTDHLVHAIGPDTEITMGDCVEVYTLSGVSTDETRWH